ncbi:MAG: hypothetical protein LBC30_02465 [Puniceicoccales bacterium]|jgi:hypothetical protein|nr:hypothetical protein [Puniceicoccales bacterium]
MASSVATFPLFGVSEDDDTPTSFLKRARALAKEENVSLPKYLAGMLKHAVRGHDLSKIHFYQDGSGDTYDVEEVRRTHEETLAESAAGLTTVCNSDEEVFALLEQWKKESDERIRNGNKLSA